MIAARNPRIVMLVALAVACGAESVATRPDATVPLPLPTPIPAYLAKPPELWMRAGNDLVRAPAADQAVAATYATSAARARPLLGGMRLAILTAKSSVAVGEPVRMIHALDAPDPGIDVYVMGPKEISDERIDGVAGTAQPVVPLTYDGAVERSPWADFNYDITTYTFTTPGRHTIEWHLGDLVSNVLAIDVH